MPQGLQVVLALLFVTGFSLGISLAVMIIKEKIFSKKKEPEPQPSVSADPKILYITEAPPKKRKRRRTRRSPEPALKGIILKPEEFKKIELGRKSD